MPPELQLDEASHTYTLAGKVLPAVTHILESVLRDMEGIPEHLVAAAGEFGKHVDSACHLFDRGVLDWADLDTRLAPYVRAYERFTIDSGMILIASKKRVYHPTRGYAGELDKLAIFAKRKRPHILDIKSSSVLPRSVRIQTAAYREAYVAMGNESDPTRYSLHLRPDATYRLDRYSDPSDFSLFLSCLNIYRYKNARS